VRGDYILEQMQFVAAAPEEVFAFFSDPANLARITPPWLTFRIHDAPSRLEAGSRLEYRIRWGLVTLPWVTRITRWNPPEDFQDVQEKGPYRTWIHTHHFTPTERGVHVEDRVEYALPLGFLGRTVHRLRVRRQLEDIFAHRRTSIERIFTGSPRAAARHRRT
jgi:ligand-binding SRPBCC domain-containing protein